MDPKSGGLAGQRAAAGDPGGQRFSDQHADPGGGEVRAVDEHDCDPGAAEDLGVAGDESAAGDRGAVGVLERDAAAGDPGGGAIYQHQRDPGAAGDLGMVLDDHPGGIGHTAGGLGGRFHGDPDDL